MGKFLRTDTLDTPAKKCVGKFEGFLYYAEIAKKGISHAQFR